MVERDENDNTRRALGEGILMPRIMWFDEERRILEEILESLDPASHPAVLPYRDRLPDEAWSFVVDYLRRDLYGALYVGRLIEAVAEEAVILGAVEGRFSDVFTRSIALRSRNFGVTDEADHRFTEISLSTEGTGLAYVAENLRIEAERAMFGESIMADRHIVDATERQRCDGI